MNPIKTAVNKFSQWGDSLISKPSIQDLGPQDKSAVDSLHFYAEVVSQTDGDYKMQNVYPRAMMNQVDAEIAARVYAASPYIMAAVNKIVNAVISVPLKVYFTNRFGKKVERTAGQPYTVLNNVNPLMTLAELMMDTVSWIELYGNAFWAIIPSDPDFRGVSELSIYPLNPRFVTVVPDPKQGISAYVYRIKGLSTSFPAKQVVHFKNFNPVDHYYGISNLNSLVVDMQVERFAKKQIANFFNNALAINGIIALPGLSSGQDEEIRKLKKEINYQKLDGRLSQRMLVLTGDAKYQPVMQDNGFSHTVPVLQDSLSTHAMVMGVPVPVLTGDTNNRTLIEFESFMWKQTIIPLCRRIEDILTKYLCTPLNSATGGTWTIEFDFKNVEALRLNELNHKKAQVADANTGLRSPNEIRFEMDLPPWEEVSTDPMAKEFGNLPTPVFLAKYGKQSMPGGGSSPSLRMPGSEGSRDQSKDGEAQMIDETGQKGVGNFGYVVGEDGSVEVDSQIIDQETFDQFANIFIS